MKKEIRFRLIKHLTFLENELKDYEAFGTLSWKEYNDDRGKRRNVERWIENIINSSIDIAKLILTSEDRSLPDTYKDIVKNLSLVTDFSEEDTEKLSRWVSLRNIISHEYLDVRWASIRKFISESRLFYEDFLKRVKNYLKEHPEDK
ncbi:MAG: hypothetical protein A2026_09370 [Deltaproteobacteria bacterium RBG_19FT_COMBO_46_12]|nr:MAG: hypothetical protein A2026_09370 [Deltaproteobacteria bacterium RBG_19FT_COMBO_46_12]